jgi:hypothetical protein
MPDEVTGSILTPSQRQMLRGERNDVSEATKRMTKTRIYERIGVALTDLELIIENVADDDLDLSKVSDKIEGPAPVWTLAALLFMWADTKDTVGSTAALTEGWEEREKPPKEKLQAQIFDGDVARGVRRVLKEDPPEQVVNNVDNTLTIELGPVLSELNNAELSDIPRTYLDQLFRAGKIDKETYADAVAERFEKMDSDKTDDMEFRPPF